MEQSVEQIGKAPGFGKAAPLEQSFEHRLEAALIVKSGKIIVLDRKERRSPGLEPVRAAAGFSNRSQYIENVRGLAGLEKNVLLIEREWNASLTQVLTDFGAIAVGPGQNVDIPGSNLARRLFVITNFDRLV